MATKSAEQPLHKGVVQPPKEPAPPPAPIPTGKPFYPLGEGSETTD
jgi:hypothetical protein